ERRLAARPVVAGYRFAAVLREGRQLTVEEAGVLRRDRSLLRALRVAVHVLAGDAEALGDVLRREAHRDVDVRDRVVAAHQPRVQLLCVLRVAGDLRRRLDAGRDEGVALAGLDRVERHPDRLQARRAEAVDGRSRDLLGKACEEHRAPGEIHPLLLLREAAADHHVHDLGRVELRHLLDRGADRERHEVVGAHVDERALVGSSDRRPRRVDDDGFGHQTNALAPVSARPMISFWIWLVPSYKVVTLASRRYLPTGYSST